MRPTWEYKSLMITTAGISTTYIEDGVVIPLSVNPTALTSKFNELGAEGWEMTGVVSLAPSGTGVTTLAVGYWFKRQT